MIEIRIHGRGGQGAVVASAVLASALFYDGRYVQAFPAFGVERRGAPVMAFTRWDFKPIRLRTNVYQPDHVIVLDWTLIMEGIDVSEGLKEKGWILINSGKGDLKIGDSSKYKVAIVDAGGIAAKHKLGTATAPVVNTAILGAFSKITGMVTIGSVIRAIRENVPVKQEENVAAAREAYSKVHRAI
jgi:2-oxoacid:acceptor oxidoreductase gamma subunit (pyruvate/2-ketoisovalerate family)